MPQANNLPQIIPGNRRQPRASRSQLPTACAMAPPETGVVLEGGQELPRAVILTAISEEFQAVRKHLSQQGLRRKKVGGTLYLKGQFQASDRVWEVAVAQIGEGNSEAGSKTTQAIYEFAPQVILFVGVAGGIKDVDIGDIVVATRAFNYSFGKESKHGAETRSIMATSSHSLVQHAKFEAEHKAWLERIPNRPLKIPKIKVKPIASGDKLIDEITSYDYRRIRKNYSDAVAVEMEGFGFLQAADASHYVHALVIRGISDLVEGKSEADKAGSQVLAAQNASAFAFEVLSRFGEDDEVLDTLPPSRQRIEAAKDSANKATLSAAHIPLEESFPKDTAIVYVTQRDKKLLLSSTLSTKRHSKVSQTKC